MWEWLGDNIVGIVAGGLAGATLKIVYDHLREKKNLLFIVSSRKVLERNRPEIEIRYGHDPIERLYSHEAIVSNKGFRGLKDIPVKIMCESGRFVEPVEITNIPPGAIIEKNLQEDGKLVAVKCDLLKRKEEF